MYQVIQEMVVLRGQFAQPEICYIHIILNLIVHGNTLCAVSARWSSMQCGEVDTEEGYIYYYIFI